MVSPLSCSLPELQELPPLPPFWVSGLNGGGWELSQSPANKPLFTPAPLGDFGSVRVK
jgi:hypothetical protein